MTYLIDNTYDYGVLTRISTEAETGPVQIAISMRTGAPRAGVSVHITPTKRRAGSRRRQG